MTKHGSQYARSCVHFNGVQNGECQCGIPYAAAARDMTPAEREKADKWGGGEDWALFARIPCFTKNDLGGADPSNLCDGFRLPTADEVRAYEAEVNGAVDDMLNRMARFADPAVKECPQCGEPATGAQKVGRCTYVSPCGHRAYQGDPPDWARARVANPPRPPGHRPFA